VLHSLAPARKLFQAISLSWFSCAFLNSSTNLPPLIPGAIAGR